MDTSTNINIDIAAINKLFIELSQVATIKTAREIDLEKEIEELRVAKNIPVPIVAPEKPVISLSEETSNYNERRYGKPWIASVSFEKSKPIFEFGTWVGDAGYSGLLELKCYEGSIVARGQKDNRNARYSAPIFYVVKDGVLSESVSKKEAYLHYKNTDHI